MSKTEFLAELARHLQVLEESEQEDILEEYAQHIDMKIQGGLSEEEAIGDFGSVRELAADILTAYHVRPDFGGEGGKQGFTIKAPNMDKVKQGGKQAAEAAGRQAGRFGSWLRALGGRFRRGWRKFWGLFARKKTETAATPSPAGRARRQRMGRGLKGFFAWLGRGIWTLGRWLWNTLWGCVGLVCLVGALGCLFAFGMLLVWLMGGYPFVGATLATLGLTLALGATALLVWTLLRVKARETVRPLPADGGDGSWEDWEGSEDFPIDDEGAENFPIDDEGAEAPLYENDAWEDTAEPVWPDTRADGVAEEDLPPSQDDETEEGGRPHA